MPAAPQPTHHPHVRGAVQLEKGLYVPMVVRGGVEPPLHAEHTFVLDAVNVAASLWPRSRDLVRQRSV